MDKKDFIVWASKLQDNYKINAQAKQHLSQVDLIAIVGPTGVGKSTIIDQLNFPKIKSDVTRAKRPGEKDNQGYHFRDDYMDILQSIKAGEYAQYVINSVGEFYGTRQSEYPQSGYCTMAVYASAIPHFREIGFRSVTCFYIMPPSYVEWMRRIGGVRTEDLLTRISEAKGSILQALDDEGYHFILNDTLEFAMRDIHAVLNKEEPNSHRADLARGTADVLLEKIGDS